MAGYFTLCSYLTSGELSGHSAFFLGNRLSADEVFEQVVYQDDLTNSYVISGTCHNPYLFTVRSEIGDHFRVSPFSGATLIGDLSVTGGVYGSGGDVGGNTVSAGYGLSSTGNEDDGFFFHIDTDVVGSFASTIGLSDSTTDNLTEGSTNLYYTDERVDDRVNNLLTSTAPITISYNDSSDSLSITHDNISLTSLTITADDGLNPEESFTFVNGITANDQGHITNLEKRTVTLPAQYTPTAASTTDSGIVELATNQEAADAVAVNKVLTPSNLSSLTTVGTITSGTWQGAAIADNYISSAANWNTCAASNHNHGTGTTGVLVKFNDTSGSLADSLLSEVVGGVSVNGNLSATNLSAATCIYGNLLGNVTGNLTGNVTGNADTVTNGIYNTDEGTVTNTMLAGSITNAKLANSNVTIGSTSISLGDTATAITGLESVTSTAFTGNLTGNVTGTVSDISNHTTDNLSEGTNNLYYTDERVDDRVSNLIVEGDHISTEYNDDENSLTVSVTSVFPHNHGTGTQDKIVKYSNNTGCITDSIIAELNDGVSVNGNLSATDLSASGTVYTDSLSTATEIESPVFIGNLRGAVTFTAQAGEALAKGDVVYISGISGNTTIVGKADANESSKMPAFGVAGATVNQNANVIIINFGSITNLDTSSFVEGTELFVGTTPGQLVDSAPAGESSLIQKIAKVTRQHETAGSMTVMGAGRTNAVPNLNEGRLFVGNSSNQSVADNTVYIDISNNKVGIGNTQPNQLLTVSGNISASGDVCASNLSASSTIHTNNLCVNNDLTVVGNFIVQGDTTTLNTTVTSTSAFEVSNAGTGPALLVCQTGEESIAHFVDGYTDINNDPQTATALFIADGGNVGIKTSDAEQALTVSGNITASGDLTATNIYGSFTGNVTGDVTGNADTVTNGVYTTDEGTVTNTMLAGSIANDKLANSSITINGTSINLGDSGSIDTSVIAENTNLYYTDERVDDRVSNLIVEGDHISSVYNDANDSLTIGVSSVFPHDHGTGTQDKIVKYSNNTGCITDSIITELTDGVCVTGNLSATCLSAATCIYGNLAGNVTGNADTVTNGVYTTDEGTVTNTMLAGSIANDKLANSSLTIGSTTISLGDTVTTIAGLSSVTSTDFIGTLTGNVSGCVSSLDNHINATQQTVAAEGVSSTADRTYSIQKDSNSKLVVNVPWVDNNTTYNAATNDTLGLVKLVDVTTQACTPEDVSSTVDRTYAVQFNASDQLVVNVPWVDNNTTYDEATDQALGLVKLGSATVQTEAAETVSSTADRTYAVQFNASDQLVVNVPWVDTTIANTNTTYSVTTVDEDASNAKIRLTDSDNTDDDITITVAQNLTISATPSSDQITITGPDLSSYATESYVDTSISNLVASAPEALDTLNELAAALGDDANFSTTITTCLGELSSAIDTKQNTLTFGIADTNALKVDDADAASQQYARFTANGLEGRSIANLVQDLELGTIYTCASTDYLYSNANTTLRVDQASTTYIGIVNSCNGAGAASALVLDSLGGSATFKRTGLSFASGDNAHTSDKLHIQDPDGIYIYNSGGTNYTTPGISIINDNVGIGTNNPGTDKLKVCGTVCALGDISGSGGLSITGTIDSGGTITSSTSLRICNNSNLGLIIPTTLTDNRTYTLQNASGTLAFTSDLDDVLVDGDFTSQGIMLRGASEGSYGILTDNSSNWNDVYTSVNGASATWNTALVDGDFASQGIMLRGATEGTYSILTDNSSNWNDVYTSVYGASATWDDKQDALTFGIGNNNALKVDDADAADNDYARFTANGLEGRSAAEVRDDLGLGTISLCATTDFDKYTGWVVSDGTDSETIASGDTLIFEANQNTSVVYCPTTNKVIISGPDLSGYASSTHNHDDRYYTETESDSKYLLNTTDTLTGILTVTSSISSGATITGDFLRVKSYTNNYTGLISSPATGFSNDNTFILPDNGGTIALTSDLDDVLVDGDFVSQGIMLRGATEGAYSILTDNSSNWNDVYTSVNGASANWNTAFSWNNHANAGYCTNNDFVTGGVFDSQNVTFTKNDDSTFAVDLSGYNYECLINKPTKATNTDLGLVKLGSSTVQTEAAEAVSSTTDRTYAVQFNASDQLVVNVPWVDNNTTYDAATNDTLGLVRLVDVTTQACTPEDVSSTVDRTYAVQFNACNQLVVNVPWVDTTIANTDTTYCVTTVAVDTTNAKIRLTDSNNTDDDITITVAQNLTISATPASDKITITGPDLSSYATETYVDTSISNLVDSAPTTLDTLNELAAALGDDANFSTTITTCLGELSSAIDTKQNTLTFGIANNNALKVDDADAADNDYAKFTANGLEGRSAAEVRTDLNIACLGRTTHTLTNLNTEALWSQPAGYQTMVRATSSCGLPDDHGQSYFGYTITSRRDTGGGYSALLTAYDNSELWFTYQNNNTSYPTWRRIWHENNDGPNSGLNADLLDNQEGAYYLDYSNFNNTPTIPTNYLTNDADDTMSGTLTVTGNVVSNSSIIAEGNLCVNGTLFWFVDDTDRARQRADARDDATNFARLHWYGQNDAGSTSNFRHAWYDGEAYIHVTATSCYIDFDRTACPTCLKVDGTTIACSSTLYSAGAQVCTCAYPSNYITNDADDITTGLIDFHVNDSGTIIKSGNTSATGTPDQFFIAHNLGDVNIGNSRGIINISQGGFSVGGSSVLVDGDFASQGIMLRGATEGTYSILTDNSSNWNDVYTSVNGASADWNAAVAWGNHATAGYQSALTFGIGNNNALKVDDADAADNDYARFTANGLEGRSATEVREDLGLGTIYNCAATDFDKYSGWVVSDGTDSETIASGDTLTFEASQNTEVVYCPTTNKVIITGPDLTGYASSTHNHDDRYYTETESDSKYLLNTTDTLTGDLTVSGNVSAAQLYDNGKRVCTAAYPTVGSGCITITAGTDLSTGGDFNVNQAGAVTITIDHSDITRTDTNSTASPANGGTVSVIDSITSNDRGHITAANVKTITLPSNAADADTVDSLHASQFVRSDANDTKTGNLDFTSNGGCLSLSNYGRVGIGMTDPQHPLEICLGDNSTFASGLVFVQNSGNRGSRGHSNGSALFQYCFSDHPGMILNKDGNVGIGTDAPNTRLTVSGCISADTEIYEAGKRVCTAAYPTVGSGCITITAGTDLSTGGAFNVNQAGAATITIDHSDITRTDTNSNESPAHGGTVSVIDSITSNARGHITAANVKTITLPSVTNPNNATITLSAGLGLETGGDFTTNQNADETIVFHVGVGSGLVRSENAIAVDDSCITAWSENTTYNAATNDTLGLVKLVDVTEQTEAAEAVSSTADRTYAVQFNASDQLVVNVPWTDTTIANTNTTYSVTTVAVDTTNAKIRLTDSDNTDDDITITVAQNLTISATPASDTITITGPDLSGYALTANLGTAASYNCGDFAAANHTHANATSTASGFVELATDQEVANAVSTTKVLTPSNLSSLTTVGTITAGTWQGTAIADDYIASAADWNTCATSNHTHSAYLLNTTDTFTGNLTVTGNASAAQLYDNGNRVCTAAYPTSVAGSSGCTTKIYVYSRTADTGANSIPFLWDSTTAPGYRWLAIDDDGPYYYPTYSRFYSCCTCARYAAVSNTTNALYGCFRTNNALTAYRYYNVPNASGTLALTSNIPTNNNQLTNGAGYTTCTGDITNVIAGTGLEGGGTSGDVTLNLPSVITAGTYGSTGNSCKIDTITVDAQGRVTAIACGATGSSSANYYVNSVAFATGTGELTLGRSGLTDLTVDLDGRYCTSDTNTTYSAGTGLTLTSTTFAMDFTNVATTDGFIYYDGTKLKNTNCHVRRVNDDVHIGRDSTATGGLGVWGFISIAGRKKIVVNNCDYVINAEGCVRGQVFTAYSDGKYKTDVNDITNAVSTVKNLRGVCFKWNDCFYTRDGGTVPETRNCNYGLIAQEVEEYLPDIVSSGPHVDLNRDVNDPDPNADTFKSMTYDSFIPFLIEAIKEQQTKIEELEDRLATLELQLNT